VNTERMFEHFGPSVSTLICVAILGVGLILSPRAAQATHKAHHHRHHRHYLVVSADANGNSATVIGSRPRGCPAAYCGCGLARYLGLNDKRLNLAWNWVRMFPRTEARPGVAAVRHGHVMLLREHIAGAQWRVVDFNGGHHLSWVHVRNVRGYVFVQPGVRSADLSFQSMR
jgi:hypothetical protein